MLRDPEVAEHAASLRRTKATSDLPTRVAVGPRSLRNDDGVEGNVRVRACAAVTHGALGREDHEVDRLGRLPGATHTDQDRAVHRPGAPRSSR